MQRKTGTVWFGLVLSVICLWLALRQVELNQVMQAFGRANYWLIGLGAGIQLVVLVVIAMRWQRFFQQRIGFLRLLRVLLIAQLANSILPMRLGVLMRVYLIGKESGISKTLVFGTVVGEKVFDSLLFLLLFVMVMPYVAPGWFHLSALPLSTGLFLVFFPLMFLVTYRRQWFLRVGRRILMYIPGEHRLGLSRRLETVIEGLSPLQGLGNMMVLWGWTLLIAALGILVNYVVMQAFDIVLSPIAAVFLLIALQMGSRVPGLLGGIGVFQYICVYALSLFGVDATVALSYGFMLHFVVFLQVVFWVPGAFILCMNPCNISRKLPKSRAMRTILCFSTVDWDGLWHRPQALMSRFATEGYHICYVDTIGLRSPNFRDFAKIKARFTSRAKASSGVREVTTGIRILSPFQLPFLNSHLIRRVNVGLLMSALKHLLGDIKSEDLIVWVYLPTWTVDQCVRNLNPDMLIYDCIDALVENPAGVSRDFEISEREISERSNLVLTTSETLFEEKKNHNPNTFWVPSGVPESWFDVREPELEVIDIPGPRIGVFGTLDHRIDMDLLTRLARAHPNWSFVLIGVTRVDMSCLVKMDNIHFLGHKPHSELPGYLAGIDVFLLPYVVDGFTHFVQPAKLYECLVFGKPIVATRLTTLTEFADVVYLASDIQSFENALDLAVAEDNPELASRRCAIAHENSWESRFRQIRELVENLEI